MLAMSGRLNAQLGLLKHFYLLDIVPIGRSTKGLHVFVKRSSRLVRYGLAFEPNRITLDTHQESMLRCTLETSVPNGILLTKWAELHFGKAVISWVVPSRTTI